MTSQLEHSKPHPGWVNAPYSESGMMPDSDAISRLRAVQQILGCSLKLTVETLGDGLVIYRLEEKD